MAEQLSLFTKIDSSEKKENGTCQLQDSYVQSLLDKTETNQMFEALINNTSVRHSFCKSFTYRLLQPFPSHFPHPPPQKKSKAYFLHQQKYKQVFTSFTKEY